jgi:5-methylcytosine-specific restriction protein B
MEVLPENYLNVKRSEYSIVNPKNIILYGPPGVGKTYSHKKLISILENGDSLDELSNANYPMHGFESVKHEGRYQFLTFHQSYSYEDFVEGFRPTDEGTIQLQNGLFKDIAKQAKINQEASTAKKIKKDFDTLFRSLIVDMVSDGERLTIPMKRSRYHITEITDKSILFDKDNGESKHSLSINTVRKMYESDNNSLIIGGLQPYYDALLEYISKNAIEIRTDELKNYYLILDEINRGNISKIFGELITLLEDDKRMGEPNELMVTLPYSKERFGVPRNLYIIGTMNTADKSIALVDIALRRRFTFVRMEPLENYLPENIRKINEIIKDRRGSDYLIGHGYFMGNQEHNFVMKYKIRPLLEEYFYGENIDDIFVGLI